ncbi:MAG: hypothetical protein QXK37_03255 [Candidatus Woesearchaeota archaeon]
MGDRGAHLRNDPTVKEIVSDLARLKSQGKLVPLLDWNGLMKYYKEKYKNDFIYLKTKDGKVIKTSLLEGVFGYLKSINYRDR